MKKILAVLVLVFGTGLLGFSLGYPGNVIIGTVFYILGVITFAFIMFAMVGYLTIEEI